jgi:Lrp/AsnC family transcriptional regulator of ectoine degradation
MKLDARDIAILRVLTREGRIAKAALADRVHLSPTACWTRLRRMEEAGLIESYRAHVNLRALAPHTTVFVTAELHRHTAADFARFEAAVRVADEVTGCWALGGGVDYILQVVTRDVEAYQRFMDGLLEREVGLARYFSYIVTKPVKGPGPPPIDLLVGRGDDLSPREGE